MIKHSKKLVVVLYTLLIAGVIPRLLLEPHLPEYLSIILSLGLFVLLTGPYLSYGRHIFFVHKARIAIACILGGVFYFSIIRHVFWIDFWWDEMGVFSIAQLPFNRVTHESVTTHVMALPLDYWLVWFWSRIVSSFPIEQQEIWMRIPYMIIHLLSSFIFGLTIHALATQRAGARNIIRTYTTFILSFGFFFFSTPILLYAFEVRFYAFAILGSVVTAYLFLTDRIYDVRFMPLLVLFSLNSYFQIVLTVCILVYMLFKKRHEAILIYGCMISILFITFFPFRFSLPTFISVESTVEKLSHAVQALYALTSGAALYVFVIVILFVTKSLHAYAKKCAIIIGMGAVVLCLLALSTRYFAFTVRHMLFLLPFVYVATCLPMVSHKRMVQDCGYVIILILLFTKL